MTDIALNRKAVEPARLAYIAASRDGLGPTHIVEAVLKAYVLAADDRLSGPVPVRRLASLSPCSRALAALDIGQSVVLQHVDASNLSRYFETARRVLGNPAAKWTARSLPDRSVRVKRNPDGFSGKDPTKNPIAVELAAITVGESILSKVASATCKGGSWQNAKLRARLILSDPRADWSRRATNKGLRVVRIDPDLTASDHGGIRAPVEVGRIAHAVAIKHRTTIAALVGPSRKKPVSDARHEFIGRVFDIRRNDGARRYGHAQIGRFIGRDRTTVINSVKRWAEMCAEARRAA